MKTMISDLPPNDVAVMEVRFLATGELWSQDTFNNVILLADFEDCTNSGVDAIRGVEDSAPGYCGSQCNQ